MAGSFSISMAGVSIPMASVQETSWLKHSSLLENVRPHP